MYSANNTAKEYVLRDIASLLEKNRHISILDFACGDCSIWETFLEKHPQVEFYALDFNKKAIEKAQECFPQFKHNIYCLDGQKNVPIEKKFDVITTFSSLEHVRNKEKFITNMNYFLKKEGILYLNYDSGHFHLGLYVSILNVLSQIIAYLKITEKYFTKKVFLREILSITKNLNLKMVDIKFFNLLKLKDIHKNLSEENLLEKWYNYEVSINNSRNKRQLRKEFLSTVIKLIPYEK